MELSSGDRLFLLASDQNESVTVQLQHDAAAPDSTEASLLDRQFLSEAKFPLPAPSPDNRKYLREQRVPAGCTSQRTCQERLQKECPMSKL